MNARYNFRPTVLCILDGWGLRMEPEGNAIALASTPVFDRLMAACPVASLVTHGEAVGLPPGSIGNSEVGHIHIGAGRTIPMEMQRINRSIASGEFPTLSGFRKLANRLSETGGTVHVIGLVTNVGVHCLSDHIVAAAHAMHDLGVPVAVHALADGRDSAPGLAARLMDELASSLPESVGIATVGGRYFGMDRDRRWHRIERAWLAMVSGKGSSAATAGEAVLQAAGRGETDEFIRPTVIGSYAGMKDGDAAIIANFRSDRARQMAAALGQPDFCRFDVSTRPQLAGVLGMVNFFGEPRQWISALFERQTVSETLGEVVSRNGLSQLRIAETEKFPHVTYFLNGGREQRLDGEERQMAQSPKVATYDLAPQMAADEVGKRLVAGIESGHDLVVVNFANPDMVGHTGVLEAAVSACEAVDRALGDAVKAVIASGGAMIVTADHGNCEEMIDKETGAPHTAHTTNPVPMILVGGPAGAGLDDGTLSDLAPTVLDMMGLEQPGSMTGRSLIVDRVPGLQVDC